MMSLALFIPFLFMSMISLNHLYDFSGLLVFSSTTLGILAWGSICFILLGLSQKSWRHVICILLIFFCFGFWRGPFLEPPSDPFEHLRRIHSFSEITSAEMPKENMGVWHYSMAGILINSYSGEGDARSMLNLIDIAHGFFLGILMAGLFVLGRRSGLKSRWSFFSCLVVFLFLGTNRFSYFSYYSFAPSFTSLFIVWLWTAVFFFRRDVRSLFFGSLSALMCMPVLWINHSQEAVFIGFILIIWFLLNSYFVVDQLLRDKEISHNLNSRTKNLRSRRFFNYFYFSLIFFILIVIPQFSLFREFLSNFFVRDYWQYNQAAVFTFSKLYLWGKIWSFRIQDTLGYIALVMLIFSIPFFWPGFIRQNFEKKIRIWTLALFPFLGYCLPLFHFIWLSNVRMPEYYRLCYISFFWLLFAHFFQGIEGRIYLTYKGIMKKIRKIYMLRISRKHIQRFAYLICCSSALILSTFRTAPVYGKLPFILLDARPWWPEWEFMINKIMAEGDKPIYTDPTTSVVLNGIFDQETVFFRRFYHSPYLIVETLNQMNRPFSSKIPFWAYTLLLREYSSVKVKEENETPELVNEYAPASENSLRGQEEKRPYRCLINLHGFIPTWVSLETNHWRPSLAYTSMFYRYHSKRGEDLEQELKKFPPENCFVFY